MADQNFPYSEKSLTVFPSSVGGVSSQHTSLSHPAIATASAKNYSVMIVDDHPLMIRAVEQLLSKSPRLHVVAKANSGEEALAAARMADIDAIVLDLNMRGMSGLETLVALRAEGCRAKIIILTVSDSPCDIANLINAGADAYLLKDSEPEDLLEQILLTADGNNFLSEDIQNSLDEENNKTNPLEKLTDRETCVLNEVAKGQSNKEVARELAISEETVKVHIRNVLRKLDVRSRVAATVMFLENRA
ncbi:response regulator [Rouxiella badensis subsp. acadiensis]|jgi:two-component system nitrate/nitrite response regulator NarP|uniref:DNA-binding response regulator n=2 Tax=Rouxiella badensis TaxID=1646377 RepID=A0A1X0WA71_9GAMM|nr:DNA-binding response regulator [Rouxiella badensis]QOI56003.1 response regulator [Rouxiella badensis subsp. acadiensis]